MSSTSLYRVGTTGGATDKVDIILGAYSQLRISGITRSPTPEDLETALCRLENMAAEFETTSDAPGYNFEDVPDPNSPSNIMRGFRHCYETNLAVRLIPDFNKAVPQSLMAQASQSLSNMVGRLAAERARGTTYPDRMPVGSGNTYRWSRWARFYRDAGDVPLSNTSDSMFVGDVRDYTENYDSYLNDGEVISSYSIVTDDGLTLSSDSNTDTDVSYRLTGGPLTSSLSEAVSQVTIIVTTDAGRVDTRIRYIQVLPTGAS